VQQRSRQAEATAAAQEALVATAAPAHREAR
jgi:hypothetical protein